MHHRTYTSPAPYFGPIIPFAYAVGADGKPLVDENDQPRKFTSDEIAAMPDKPAALRCLCGEANLLFRGSHPVKGGKWTSNYFQTCPGSTHAPRCEVHFNRAAAAYTRSGMRYDSSKPFRIHLNLNGEKWKEAELGQSSFRIYNKDGSFVDSIHREWEAVSIRSIQYLLKFMDSVAPERLKDSVVILKRRATEGRAIAWEEFCLSRELQPWKNLYDQPINGKNIIRLLLSPPRTETRDLFEDQNPPRRVQLPSRPFDGRFTLNVFAKLSSETESLDSRVGGHYAILGRVSVGKVYIKGVDMADLTIDATDSRFVTRFDYHDMRKRALARCHTKNIDKNPEHEAASSL